MARKIRKTKGRQIPKKVLDREEIPNEIRWAMLERFTDGASAKEVGKRYGKGPRQVRKVVKIAEEKATRHRRPLLDVKNVQNSPGRRHPPWRFTDTQKKEIVEKATENRESREKNAWNQIQEQELDISESLFQIIMYEHRQHYLAGAENPLLNDGGKQHRVRLATYLLKHDLKTIVFLDQANMRSEYGKPHTWHSPEEYFHPDVKQGTSKQDYQKAEFMGAIKHGEKPGPFRIFKKETLAEQMEMDRLIRKMQEEELPRLRKEFDAREAAKDVSYYATTKALTNFPRLKHLRKVTKERVQSLVLRYISGITRHAVVIGMQVGSMDSG